MHPFDTRRFCVSNDARIWRKFQSDVLVHPFPIFFSKSRETDNLPAAGIRVHDPSGAVEEFEFLLPVFKAINRHNIGGHSCRHWIPLRTTIGLSQSINRFAVVDRNDLADGFDLNDVDDSE